MKEPTPCAISVVGSFSDLSSRPGGTGLREFPATGSPLDGSLENRRRTPPIEGGSAGHNAPRCGAVGQLRIVDKTLIASMSTVGPASSATRTALDS